MLRKGVCIFIILFCFSIINVCLAQEECAQKAPKDICNYYALNTGNTKIKIDGNLDDWKYVEGKFLGKDFWEALGEQYSGENDLSVTWWTIWDKNNLYVAFSVKDDTHQNSKGGDTIYAGDGIQICIDPTGKRATHSGVCYEYGYALAGGKLAVWRWMTNPATKGENSEFAIVRDESKKMTYYEIRIPVGDIAPTELDVNKTIGWGFVVNESDSCDCQGGWIGWASRSIVHGKDATALANMIFSAKTVAVSPKGSIATTWGAIKN